MRSLPPEIHKTTIKNFALERHLDEIRKNLQSWRSKPLLRRIYRSFYVKLLRHLDHSLDGLILEVGSGIGNLKEHIPECICSDIFPNPWLDLVCDGYNLPFEDGSLSHIILFDVLHHLEAPNAFLTEAKRTLQRCGRVIVFDPYISLLSWPIYGLLHPEPIAWSKPIDSSQKFLPPQCYYAAQGNATRLFFRGPHPQWLDSWNILYAHAFSSFGYLLSGGFSKPAIYPAFAYPILNLVDKYLSVLPRLFGARCIVVLSPVE